MSCEAERTEERQKVEKEGRRKGESEASDINYHGH